MPSGYCSLSALQRFGVPDSKERYVVLNAATRVFTIVTICTALMEVVDVLRCGVFSGFENLYPITSIRVIGGVGGFEKCLLFSTTGVRACIVAVASLSAGDRSWLARNFPELRLDAAGVPFPESQRWAMRKYRLALAAGEARG